MTSEVRNFTCSLCSFTFDEKKGRSSCAGCFSDGGCNMVKCPNCGYEVPIEAMPAWMKRLANLFGHKIPAVVLILVVSLSASAAAAESVTRARWLMGTMLEVTAYGPEAVATAALTLAFDEVGRLEAGLSTFISDSELSQLNSAAGQAPRAVSWDLWRLLEVSIAIARHSGGAFDPTYGSQPQARGYELLDLNVEGRSVGLRKGAHLNFGAIAKGYALDAAAQILRDSGVRSALLNFGGQVLIVGEPPKGESWPVRIGKTGPTLRLRSGSVSTSDLSEHPGHIRDPKTGIAVKGHKSVTVIAPTATEADAWSTALFVSGLDAFKPAFPGCAIVYDPESEEAVKTAGDCSEYIDGNGE